MVNITPAGYCEFANGRIGLLVLQRNYLEVFPYDNWNSHELPAFEEGQEFMPSVCELREGETTRPTLLTEADLVGLMDKNGIGNSLFPFTPNQYSLVPQERMQPSHSTSTLS